MTSFDLASVDHVLSTTRSVRRRLDLARPVERAVVLECLRIAIQAPTGGNTQGWRWLVVTDAAKRRGRAEMYKEIADPYLADGLGAGEISAQQQITSRTSRPRRRSVCFRSPTSPGPISNPRPAGPWRRSRTGTVGGNEGEHAEGPNPHGAQAQDSSGRGQVGSPGAALSGQIDR